ncbi:hypothetical protein ES708_32654 [subsurface metagenome]
MKDYKEAHRIWYQKVGKAREAEARVKIKIETLTHYGNGKLTCSHCDESRLACLSLDHINGNGCKERDKLKRWGYRFYLMLKKQGWPEGFQTLCMNCQFVKAVTDRVKQREIPS